jgi:hypothetical protein
VGEAARFSSDGFECHLARNGAATCKGPRKHCRYVAAHANELRPSPIAQQQEAIQSRAAGGGVMVLNKLNVLSL